MNRTLQEHLDSLRTRLDALDIDFMAAADRPEANTIEAGIRTVRMAIAHYGAAIELEKSLDPDSNLQS
jgi:hypothetical protein